MHNIEYNRNKAIAYAHKWAYERNPKYYNFNGLGGDCTNFISQVLFAGCSVMNYSKELGWYYKNLNSRSPSWTGVEFLYNFLIGNKGAGPYAIVTDIENIIPGDIIQLKFKNEMFEHSLVVVDAGSVPNTENILLAAHTFNIDYRPLVTYDWSEIRYIHILGARKY